MKLAEMTWTEVEKVSRDVVVLIPTGSCEQHGPHLPVFTDSILATAAGEGVERAIPDKVLLTPTLWLGASGHHLAFPGTLSASFDAYMGAIESVVLSLSRHGFHRFYIVNGHGGNSEPNGVVLRRLKEKHPNLTVGHSGYFAFAAETAAQVMEGPAKEIRHACEAEASLMMHVRPELVREDRLRDDGLKPEPAVRGVIHHFDQITEQGSLGYATYAKREKGQAIMDQAIKGLTQEVQTIYEGYVLEGL